jgi:hypothetical protein
VFKMASSFLFSIAIVVTLASLTMAKEIFEPEIPIPSKDADRCNLKITQSGLAQPCLGPISSLKQLFRFMERIVSGDQECCDFNNFHSCFESKAPLVCTPTETAELRVFFKSTMDYLLLNRCPGFKLTECNQFEEDDAELQVNVQEDEIMIARAMTKLENYPEFNQCMENNYEEDFCANQWNAVHCRERLAGNVCSVEELSVLRRFDEQYVLYLNSGVCRGEPFPSIDKF